MKVIRAYPPNFSQIAAAFPVKGVPGIIYAYGDRIYAPGSKGDLSSWILAHEEVHGRQQNPKGPYHADMCGNCEVRKWWTNYIVSPQFRLEQEIPAHRAEWEAYTAMPWAKGGQAAGHYLINIAERLSGSLYGNLISKERAIEEITR